MDSIKVSRIVLFLIVIALAIGGYRWWSQSHSPSVALSAPAGAPPAPQSGGVLGKIKSLFQHSPQTSGAASSPGAGAPGDITVLTTATKAQWLDDEIAAFNSANAGKYHATRLPLLESRDAMQVMLAGKSQPTIWSPSSPVWIARFSEVWAQRNGSRVRIADMDDPQNYRVLLKSPLVVLTTHAKAPFLKSVFAGSAPWSTVRELSAGTRKAPWGKFRFAHADPLDASSGMLTMSLILGEYAQQHGQEGDMEQAAQSAAFTQYLIGVERGFLYDPNTVGSSALEKSFEANPSTRDFITAYESKALEATENDSNLTMVYPRPTAVAEQAAVVLNAPWVSDAQREGGQALLRFLASDESLKDGMKYHFRPAHSGGMALQEDSATGFQQSYSAIELPPYGALNDAANQWRVNVAHRGAQL
ncbi:hypothetical protein CCAX7_002030 [Capsulimonas corticalis]|uniref:Uncharacterized protein n=1 Tax=Capsulimonas corticalis TaxID=2219043 RepID=A0A402CRZ0_9BACT|nr:extracellular solute-binding protein [Capsulimonas corticalis]BDI28152.1 hypothetical protein CCAX7_002030 [Capsulimonas corticalis]